MALKRQSKNNRWNHRNYNGKYYFGFRRVSDKTNYNRHIYSKNRHQMINRNLYDCDTYFVYGKGRNISMSGRLLWNKH